MPARSASDIDLLAAFAALLDKRSVGGAARQLAVTQSAVSKRLSRLRDLFADDLFVRQGDGVAPTAKALELADGALSALHQLQQLLAGDKRGRPESWRRTFRIAGNDLAAALILPGLMKRLRVEAPQVRVIWRSFERTAMADALERGDVDFALTVLPDPPSSVRREPVRRARFVCLASESHPFIKRRLTLDDFVRAPHLLVTLTGDLHGVVDRLLEERGLSRKVVLSLPFHLAAPILVAQTDLIATVPDLVADLMPWHGVRRFALPLPHDGFDEMLYWHRRREADTAHAWLRRAIVELGRQACGPVAR